jgi:hypothetical protein
VNASEDGIDRPFYYTVSEDELSFDVRRSSDDGSIAECRYREHAEMITGTLNIASALGQGVQKLITT